MSQTNRYETLQNLFLDLQKCMKELAPLIDETKTFEAGVDPNVLSKLHWLNCLSNTILEELQQIFCEKCGALPVWFRSAQFGGKSLFCDKCAREEVDFMTNKPGDSFFWRKIRP